MKTKSIACLALLPAFAFCFCEDRDDISTRTKSREKCSASGQRVAVLAFNTQGNHNVMNEMSVAINAFYTQKHGYDLIVERCSPDPSMEWTADADPMSINFAKPFLVLRHLPNYDSVVLLDADAHFRDFSMTVEHVLDLFLCGQESILVGQDCFDSSFCWSRAPNTGVMFFRNVPSACAFLEHWAAAPRPGGLCDKSLHIDHREQGCFGTIISEVTVLGKAVKILSKEDTYLINSNNGTFILHHVGHYGSDRMDRLQREFDALLAQFKEGMHNV
jgi:hypothetical protein